MGFGSYAKAALFALTGLTACAHDGASSASADSVSTDFNYTRNQIVLPANLGAEPANFLLDCALDPSLIEMALARRMDLLTDPLQIAEAEGGGDEKGQEITPAVIRELTIGELRAPPFDAVAADLARFSESLGMPLAGALGYSFFKDRVIRVDYRDRRVDIARSIDALPPQPAGAVYEVPLEFMSDEDLIPVVDVVVANRTLRVSVDTGSSLGIQLYETAARDLGIEASGETSAIIGARGRAEVVNTELVAVSLGPFTIAGAPATLSKRKHDPAERVGNLGNQFLENFVVTFDYVEGRLLFQLSPPPPDAN
ncbi:MAG: aspartyl protease family protein [Parvularculaceae bacterium]